MTPTCWPNQMWKIVTFLTMFLGTDLSQEKQKILNMKYLILVRDEHKPLLLPGPNTPGLESICSISGIRALEYGMIFLLTGLLFFQSRLFTDNVDFICPLIFFLLVKYNLLSVTYYKGYVCTYRKLKRNTERCKVRNPRIA